MTTRTLTTVARKETLLRTVAHIVERDNGDVFAYGAPRDVRSVECINECCYVATLRNGDRARLLSQIEMNQRLAQEALAAGHTLTVYGEAITSVWTDASGSWIGRANRTSGMIHGGIIADLARQAALALGRDIAA